MTSTDLTLLGICLSILVLGFVLGYAMTHEYRNYLDEHPRMRFRLSDFVKRERFYIYLFLALTFIILQNLWLVID